MPITTGGFEDLVQLSQDTLYYVGPDLEIGNTVAGSSASLGFNNTAGDLVLVGVATGNATVNLPQVGGTLLTNINLSAGTTSNNLTAVTFSNSNGVSFGLNGSTLTGSFGFNLSAGTTSGNLSAVTFSNSNNVSFGLNAGTVTGSFALNLSAGTTSNNLSAVTFANSNGISFGLNASTVTAVFGGMSSFQNAPMLSTYSLVTASNLSFQPVIVPYAITANTVVMAAFLSHSLASTGAITMYFGMYSLNGGSTGSMSLISSVSSGFTFTTIVNSTGFYYWSQSLGSWSITPGPYVFGWAFKTSNAGSWSPAGIEGNANPIIGTNLAQAMTALGSAVFSGYYSTSSSGFPANIAVSDTATWVRTGSLVNLQPWFLLQGT